MEYLALGLTAIAEELMGASRVEVDTDICHKYTYKICLYVNQQLRTWRLYRCLTVSSEDEDYDEDDNPNHFNSLKFLFICVLT
jgi:hypothetical protein